MPPDLPICNDCDPHPQIGLPPPGPPGGGGDIEGAQGPVRVGGAVKAPIKVRDVPPIYPALAIQARVQGRVQIECVISTAGVVEDVQVISGNPLLHAAALDAVREWRYTPSFLGGVPVPVIMTVTVHFILH